jgi:hypothetical protein
MPVCLIIWLILACLGSFDRDRSSTTYYYYSMQDKPARLDHTKSAELLPTILGDIDPNLAVLATKSRAFSVDELQLTRAPSS